MTKSESTPPPATTTTHPTQPPVTDVPPLADHGVGALAPAAAHPTHVVGTIMPPATNFDAPRDESIRIFRSDVMVEDAHTDLDWGSTNDEDGVIEKLDPKEEVSVGALWSTSFPEVELPKGNIEVDSFESVEMVRKEMHVGHGLATEAKEGIGNTLTSPDSQDYKKLCSKPEGNLFLEASSKGADMFNGRKLKRAMDSGDAEKSGTSTRGSKAISTGGESKRKRKRPSGRYRPMFRDDEMMPPGFL